jgi:23S rRNA pseudouridine1911/1915/1917 synthase
MEVSFRQRDQGPEIFWQGKKIRPMAFKLRDHIIFENDDFIVLNKPSGMLAIPDREGKEVSLKRILQESYDSIFVVHRLDKGTSGILVFAKNAEAHKQLSQQFENRETEKIYLGLVIGSPANKKDRINEPISEHPARKGIMVVYRKGKESLTDYEVLDDFGIFSWLQFQIHTGRTHQIRVHMKHIGHPIVCDEVYGDGKPVFLSDIKHRYKLSKAEEEERPLLNRLALHSHKLKFMGPDKRPYEFEAAIPKDLHALLQQLGKRKKAPLR